MSENKQQGSEEQKGSTGLFGTIYPTNTKESARPQNVAPMPQQGPKSPGSGSKPSKG